MEMMNVKRQLPIPFNEAPQKSSKLHNLILRHTIIPFFDLADNHYNYLKFTQCSHRAPDLIVHNNNETPKLAIEIKTGLNHPELRNPEAYGNYKTYMRSVITQLRYGDGHSYLKDFKVCCYLSDRLKNLNMFLNESTKVMNDYNTKSGGRNNPPPTQGEVLNSEAIEHFNLIIGNFKSYAITDSVPVIVIYGSTYNGDTLISSVLSPANNPEKLTFFPSITRQQYIDFLSMLKRVIDEHIYKLKEKKINFEVQGKLISQYWDQVWSNVTKGPKLLDIDSKESQVLIGKKCSLKSCRLKNGTHYLVEGYGDKGKERLFTKFSPLRKFKLFDILGKLVVGARSNIIVHISPNHPEFERLRLLSLWIHAKVLNDKESNSVKLCETELSQKKLNQVFDSCKYLTLMVRHLFLILACCCERGIGLHEELDKNTGVLYPEYGYLKDHYLISKTEYLTIQSKVLDQFGTKCQFHDL